MVADLRLVAEADRPNAGRDIEAGVPLDAERLQRNRSIGAADQHIGTGADPDRSASGGADVIPRQSPRCEIGARANTPQSSTPPFVYPMSTPNLLIEPP
jgi:hypothetical protein